MLESSGCARRGSSTMMMDVKVAVWSVCRGAHGSFKLATVLGCWSANSKRGIKQVSGPVACFDGFQPPAGSRLFGLVCMQGDATGRQKKFRIFFGSMCLAYTPVSYHSTYIQVLSGRCDDGVPRRDLLWHSIAIFSDKSAADCGEQAAHVTKSSCRAGKSWRGSTSQFQLHLSSSPNCSLKRLALPRSRTVLMSPRGLRQND